jgi:hypothetical protein
LPAWPNNGNVADWLLCTAAWGGLIPTTNEHACYAFFPIRHLLSAGMRDAALPLMARLEARLKADPKTSRCEELARAYVDAGEPAAARRTIGYILGLDGTPRDRDFYLRSVVKFFVQHGAASAAQLPEGNSSKPSKRRLALLSEMADSLLKSEAPLVSADVEPCPASMPPSLDAVSKSAEAALAELNADEWNVDRPARDLAGAIEQLIQLGQGKRAETFLAQAFARFDSGELDGRGFASAAAYVHLAKVARRLEGDAVAHALILRGLGVAGKGRQIVLPTIVSALLEVGAEAEALKWAGKVAKRLRVDVLAAVFLRTGQWPELRALLAPVVRPAEAARIAWSAVLLLEGLHRAARRE